MVWKQELLSPVDLVGKVLGDEAEVVRLAVLDDGLGVVLAVEAVREGRGRKVRSFGQSRQSDCTHSYGLKKEEEEIVRNTKDQGKDQAELT